MKIMKKPHKKSLVTVLTAAAVFLCFWLPFPLCAPAASGKEMICVPTDEMSLRMNPGLGNDVIQTLYCGDRVRWDGSSAEVNEITYYRVTTVDGGRTGYIRAEFCVPVDFEYDDSALTVVDVSTNRYTYEMMCRDIDTLTSMYPDRLRSSVIGKSLCGRDIYEVVLGNPEAEHHVLIQATIHAREYMNTQLVMRLIEYYAAYYDVGTYSGVPYRTLFDNAAFHIVPMANPDGVALCQEGIDALSSQYQEIIRACYDRDRMTMEYGEDDMGDLNWLDYYKDEEYVRDPNAAFPSFEEYLTVWKANAAGVDLNRNFDAGWDMLDQKHQPAYTDFKGNYPESEPETQALTALARSRTFDYYISCHSKGGLIYYDVDGNSAENAQASLALAETMQYATGYKPKETMKGINVVLGGFGDWVQLTLNKPSITIESGRHPCPLAINEFDSIWTRFRESFAVLAKNI